MYSLFVKEIRSFLSSVIGYVVIVVFLAGTGLTMWVFDAGVNVLNLGYANIDALFILGPLVFLFLIPAITMRSFAEERRLGTIELLLTRPLTDLQIVLAKYFAGIILVAISILPTLVYYYSVWRLGSPMGNIDTGGTWGSYMGLMFLGASFVSVGIFASSITDSQILAFLLALVLCLVCYIGFYALSTLDVFGSIETVVQSIGISEHYASIRRGVVDTRDVVYFITFNAFFIMLTKTVLESRKW
jgi:ABC-2 type transport system permease protein